MSLQYSRSLLRVVVAQLCRQLGWNAIHSSPLELLINILERYIVQLGCQAHRFSELCMFALILFMIVYTKVLSSLMLMTHLPETRAGNSRE